MLYNANTRWQRAREQFRTTDSREKAQFIDKKKSANISRKRQAEIAIDCPRRYVISSREIEIPARSESSANRSQIKSRACDSRARILLFYSDVKYKRPSTRRPPRALCGTADTFTRAIWDSGATWQKGVFAPRRCCGNSKCKVCWHRNNACINAP